MIDLRKRESEDDVYVLVYKGSEEDVKRAAGAVGRKPGIHNGSTWYFRFPSERDARAAWAKSDGKEFRGKFSYQKLDWKDWRKITANSESVVEAKFDIDREFDKVMTRYNKEKKQLPGKTPMDKIDYLLSTSDYDDDEYDSLYDRIEDYLGDDESCKNKEEAAKEAGYMIDLREKKTSKKEDDMEIKFINKGETFKSDKAEDVEIIDIKKGDDKTEVTYKLGDEEKKGDIEDVIKMLNGAEYKAVEAKKDEKKSCESEEDDAEETPEEEPEADAGETPDEEPADEKKESIEVTLTEDFYVPGTDIVLEKGDTIRIIPRQEG